VPKGGKMKDYNNNNNSKMTTSAVDDYKHTGYDNNYKINLAICFD
jgi:hypothetical protein